MKRTLSLAGLIAVLAVPAGAGANSSMTSTDADSADRAQRALSITFVLRTRNGDPQSIRKFRFTGLEANCNAGATVTIRGRVPEMKINNRNRFRGIVRREGKTVRVEGRVRNGGAKVTGFIRAKGPFGQATGCDSGQVRWTAT